MTTKIATPPAPAGIPELVIVAVVERDSEQCPVILKAEPICPTPNHCVFHGCTGACE